MRGWQAFARLLDKANLGRQERQLVENLAALRSTLDEMGESEVQQWEKKSSKSGKKKSEEVPYAVSRYVPVVKRLVEVHNRHAGCSQGVFPCAHDQRVSCVVPCACVRVGVRACVCVCMCACVCVCVRDKQ